MNCPLLFAKMNRKIKRKSGNKMNRTIAKMIVVWCLACAMVPEICYALMPIRKHLKDATSLNRKRAPLYARLSSLQSLPLSYELITMENLALVATLNLDLEASVYLKAGIGLFNDDLVDMAETPAFQDHFDQNLAPTKKIAVDTKRLKKRWNKLILNENLETIYQESVWLLEEGELKETNQNCLTRHFVESIARSIKNHQGHREKSKELNLADPKELLLSFLKIQITSLSWAQSLDKRAFPIQKDNIPLFCRDVPHINYQ